MINENLSIAEIKKKKIELIQKINASDILDVIKQFTDETGIKIDTIRLSMIDVSPMGGRREFAIGSVGIEHETVRI